MAQKKTIAPFPSVLQPLQQNGLLEAEFFRLLGTRLDIHSEGYEMRLISHLKVARVMGGPNIPKIKACWAEQLDK
jgi:hypothetical protein